MCRGKKIIEGIVWNQRLNSVERVTEHTACPTATLLFPTEQNLKH